MTSLLITLLTFIAIVFFLIRRKLKPSIKNSDGFIASGFSIQMTKQEIESECQSNEEIMKLLEESITASGFFRAEKIPELIENLRKGFIPFGRLNTKLLFNGDNILTVAEKNY